VLGWSPPWEFERLEHFSRAGGATIAISGDPNPDVFSDLDGARVGKARPKALAERSLQITFEEKTINWTIAAFPNENWARKVFGPPDVERLWEEVARAVRLDDADPVAVWRAHVEKLRTRAALLTQRRFDAVRFTGPGTDLTIGLAPAFDWGGNARDGRRHRPRREHADRGGLHRAGRAARRRNGSVDSSARNIRPGALNVSSIHTDFMIGGAPMWRWTESKPAALPFRSSATTSGCSPYGVRARLVGARRCIGDGPYPRTIAIRVHH
jgi:leucyl aminopeptidase (aminopeptidase T)